MLTRRFIKEYRFEMGERPQVEACRVALKTVLEVGLEGIDALRTNDGDGFYKAKHNRSLFHKYLRDQLGRILTVQRILNLSGEEADNELQWLREHLKDLAKEKDVR